MFPPALIDSRAWTCSSPAVLLGSLAPLADLPVTFTASRLGRPLYESLACTAAADSTWWSSR
jgi:hypothetical protein